MSNNKDLSNRIIYVITLFLIFLFIIVSVNNKANFKEINKKVIYFNDGWEFNEKPIKIQDKNGLIDYSFTENNIYTRTITKDMLGKTLSFYTSHLQIKVMIDNEVIYSLYDNNDKITSAGTLYNFIYIPVESFNKKLTIIVNPSIDLCIEEAISFKIGDKIDIYKEIINENLIDNIIIFILYLFGFQLIIFSLFFIKYLKSYNSFYVGMIAILFAAWASTETNIIDIIFNKPQISYLACYLSLYLIPIFVMQYIKENSDTNKKISTITDICTLIHVIVIISLLLLEITNTYTMVLSITKYHIFVGAEILIYVISFILYIIKNIKYKNTKQIIEKYSFTIFMMIGALADTIRYYMRFSNAAKITPIFIIIYIILIFRSEILSFVKKIEENKTIKDLKEIAYTDSLTEINNRNAFISRLDKINNKSYAIISFDVNNLKYYNDNFGHHKGDILLKTMSSVLKNIFENNVYRIGGDEFVVVLEDTNEEQIKNFLETFENKTKEYNKNSEVILQSAFGYCMSNDSLTLNDVIEIADKNMYIHKEKQKRKNKYNSSV